jgi:hypothetical protein
MNKYPDQPVWTVTFVIADYLQLSDRSYQSDGMRIYGGVQREFHHFTDGRKMRCTAPPGIGGLNTNAVTKSG